MRTLAILLCLATPALASPVTFGDSWDGRPPGTFEDLVGPAELGAADFAAGTYLISLTRGYSAWADQDIIGVAGDSYCDTAYNGCPLGGPGTTTQIYLDRPWRLWATTPNFTHQTSNGPQFAVRQTSATTWTIGLEDISWGLSDRDFQDEFIDVRRIVVPVVTPLTPAIPSTPVPEGDTLILVGLGLVLVGRRVL